MQHPFEHFSALTQALRRYPRSQQPYHVRRIIHDMHDETGANLVEFLHSWEAIKHDPLLREAFVRGATTAQANVMRLSMFG